MDETATLDLGKVGITIGGEWSASTAYEEKTIVAFGHEGYISLVNVPAGTPVSNTTYWLKISERGGDGYSPYVGNNGNWYEWSDDQHGYVDTGVSASGIFWAVYNVTTLAKIAEVHDNGQTICVKYNDNIFTLTHIENLSSVGSAVFICHLGGRAEKIVLSRNGADEQWGAPTSFIVPTALADLAQDSTHRTVSDTEKATWNSSGIFYCQKNVTPYADILAAHNSGKLCVCVDTKNAYIATELNNGYIWFESFNRGTNHRYYLTSAGVWHAQDQKYQPEITDLSDIRSNAFAGKIASDKLDYLVPYIKGQQYTFETDNTPAYQKSVLLGSKMGAVNMIGGASYKWNQLNSWDDERGGVSTNLTVNGCVADFDLVNGAHSSSHIVMATFPADVNDMILRCSIAWFPENIDLESGRVSTSAKSKFTPGTLGMEISKYNGDRNYITICAYDNPYTDETVHVKVQMLIINLTKMFGAGNEPNINNVVAKFAELGVDLSKPYDPDTGSVHHADVSKVQWVSENGTLIAEQEIPLHIRSLPGYGMGNGEAYNKLVRQDFGDATVWYYVRSVEENDNPLELPVTMDDQEWIEVTGDMVNRLDPVAVSTYEPLTSVRFVSTHNSIVPNTIEYMVELEEALS